MSFGLLFLAWGERLLLTNVPGTVRERHQSVQGIHVSPSLVLKSAGQAPG